MTLTLDHVVPLAKGGTHEPANTQIAHAVCNSRKNDSIVGDIAALAREAA
jgi:5-methylcytosine-specific restriction endonuclease McrA